MTIQPPHRRRLLPAPAHRQNRALAARFELYYTPKSAYWLVELELSAIARQCLNQRIRMLEELTGPVAACVAKRNAPRATVK